MCLKLHTDQVLNELNSYAVHHVVITVIYSVRLCRFTAILISFNE